MYRLNTIELDHRSANLSTDDVLTTIHDIPSTNGKQIIRVIDADGRKDGNGETIILPASYKSRGSTAAAARANMLAARLSARVTYIETPGVGINKSTGSLTPKQVLTVARGNFDPLASMQLDALDEVLHLTNEQEVRFIGYSMAGWATAAMALRLSRGHFKDRKIIIPRIDFIEAVNDQPYRPLDLYQRMQREAPFSRRYHNENIENGFFVSNDQIENGSYLDRHQTVAIGALSIGIPRSGFGLILKQAIDESRTTTQLREGSIHFWRTDESHVARREAHHYTMTQLGHVASAMTEIRPIQHDRPHHHPFIESLGNVANLAEHLKQAYTVAHI
jgi:hypothetical protein